MCRSVMLCAAVAACVLGGPVSAPATAHVRSCHSEWELIDFISARNMSCVAARERIPRVRYVGRRRNQPRLTGWRCQTVKQMIDGATIRCARGTRAFRWTIFGS